MKSNESNKERFEKWFIRPLKEMQQHDGFVLMLVLFPLYERHLRIKYNVDTFSENNPVFKQIGRNLGLSAQNAEIFWDTFRNGGLHNGQPKNNFVFQYSNNEPVVLREETFYINPLALRNKLLPVIFKKHMWQAIKLPEIYTPLKR